MPIRINKYISESGYCSRREADKYIEQGNVTIDGVKAEIGSQVAMGQVVKVFGEVISNNIKAVVIAYNKPVGIVSTTDSDERNNIVNAIGYPERIFPIGRLDKDSQGLILLTNEGNIVNKILRANNNHDKEYFVMVNKAITPDFIQRMQGGVPILGVVTRKCEVTQQGPKSFTIVLRQGLNRQIRRMCEYLGYSVTKLQRTRIMHIHLGNLKTGQYRILTAAEMGTLYKKIETSVGTAPETKRTKQGGVKHRSESSKRRPANATRSVESTMKNKEQRGNKSGLSARNGKGGRTASANSKSTKPERRNDSYKPRGKGQKRSNSR